ncbi:MAG: glucose-1-phosphate cytidylyltransferase [Alphaproteobacteria bacterium]|nr:glucose-1-phosphate cytidylyltransferase [Alphaproteobacteria bacterium]MBL6933406.1 glucose-1-phosphate cytidylyltransferase [Rhodospirillales bacterium]
MKVVILCGGQGTRIRDVSDNIPKPMIPIGPYPILWHIMKTYAAAGHTDFVLCLGHLGHVIKDFFLNFEAFTGDFTINLGRNREIEFHDANGVEGWRVTLADTGDAAQTGARIKRIQQYVAGEENFMLTYGDGLSDLDLGALQDFHESHGKILTVTGVRPPGRFGEIECDDKGQIVEFNEKPQATGGRISGGFLVCRPELFDVLDDREDLVFEQDPIRKLVADGEMMVFEHDEFWQCMDTARDHHLLNDLWASGQAPWKIQE